MADYQPLIQRAVEGLAEPTAGARRAVYERARTALIAQLRGLDPPLSESDFARERLALDEAIARVESGFPADPEPVPERLPGPTPPDPPPVATPVATPAPGPAEGRRRLNLPQPAAPRPPPIQDDAPASAAPAGEAEGVPQRERPRIATVGPTVGRAGRWRPAVLAAGLALPIGAIALFALANKPDPAALPQRPTTAEGTPAPDDAKLRDRVAGGERLPREAPVAQTPAPPPTSQGANAAPAPPRPEVPVAQRAILYEENPAQPQQPRAFAGRVVWRLDNVNAGQGQPLETVARATIEVPDAPMTLTMLVRRNTEATLPASHTVELTFGGGGPNRTVRDVGLLQLKSEEGTRGTPVAGVPVPVRDNLFLIGLSNVPADVERNTELLTRRSWIDLPIRFTSGQRAILSFDKGLSGETVLNEAFRAWR